MCPDVWQCGWAGLCWCLCKGLQANRLQFMTRYEDAAVSYVCEPTSGSTGDEKGRLNAEVKNRFFKRHFPFLQAKLR